MEHSFQLIIIDYFLKSECECHNDFLKFCFPS